MLSKLFFKVRAKLIKTENKIKIVFIKWGLKRLYPERKLDVIVDNDKLQIIARDAVGGNEYILEGKYSYDMVEKMNAKTGGYAGYGFCKDIGPVAFIGSKAQILVNRSGFFNDNIEVCGEVPEYTQKYFEIYSEKDAKQIANYTVYGCGGFDVIVSMAKMDKIRYYYDSRYLEKLKNESKFFNMDVQIEGKYSYEAAKMLASGSLEDKEVYTGTDDCIVFAQLQNGTNIGIIRFYPWQTKYVKGFRPVWEYGCSEPEVQQITFLSNEEAKLLDNFILFIYDYSFLENGWAKYKIEAKDRTFDNRFEFKVGEGKDPRLADYENAI